MARLPPAAAHPAVLRDADLETACGRCGGAPPGCAVMVLLAPGQAGADGRTAGPRRGGESGVLTPIEATTRVRGYSLAGPRLLQHAEAQAYPIAAMP
jgi:hypothetical protein